MSYLQKEKNDFFLGDGSRNEAGESLEEFLDNYDSTKYKNPSSTVDMAVFTISKDKDDFKILLIKRRNHPSIGEWAIPGGFVEFNEDIFVTAKRELMEETGVSGVFPVQVKTYGSPERDPRTRIVTTLYTSLVPEEDIKPIAGDDAKDVALFNVSLSNTGGSDVRLELNCEERNICLGADLKKDVIKDAFVPIEAYEIINTDGIALDHAILITEAFLFVKRSLAKGTYQT